MVMYVNINEILSKVDHTLLSPTARFADIMQVVDDAIIYKTASVCIPPSYVRRVSEYASSRTRICTVIGFPNGYSTTESKCFEASNAIANGADEIDAVINLGYVKDKKYDEILREISAIKATCGCRILKIIIETSELNENEKIAMCKTVNESGADFIKTSTGFSRGGATRDDIMLFSSYVAPHVKIKAAGGISSLEDAEEIIKLGATRLGTSRIVKLVKEMSDY